MGLAASTVANFWVLTRGLYSRVFRLRVRISFSPAAYFWHFLEKALSCFIAEPFIFYHLFPARKGWQVKYISLLIGREASCRLNSFGYFYEGVDAYYIVQCGRWLDLGRLMMAL